MTTTQLTPAEWAVRDDIVDFDEAIAGAGDRQLGLDLRRCREFAEAVAADPPSDPNPPGAAVSRVFAFELTPRAIA